MALIDSDDRASVRKLETFNLIEVALRRYITLGLVRFELRSTDVDILAYVLHRLATFVNLTNTKSSSTIVHTAYMELLIFTRHCKQVGTVSSHPFVKFLSFWFSILC